MTISEALIFGVSPFLLGLAACAVVIWTGRQDRRNRTPRERDLERDISRLMGELNDERAKRKTAPGH